MLFIVHCITAFTYYYYPVIGFNFNSALNTMFTQFSTPWGVL